MRDRDMRGDDGLTGNHGVHVVAVDPASSPGCQAPSPGIARTGFMNGDVLHRKPGSTMPTPEPGTSIAGLLASAALSTGGCERGNSQCCNRSRRQAKRSYHM